MGMTDVRGGRPTAEHAAHDPLLIARAASDDDLTPTEQATVADRLATCADCAQLHADLVAMAAGLRTDLPLPRRPRDFRIAPDIAVRGPSWRERLSRGLAGPALRPLAATICAFGLLLAVTGAVLPRATSTRAAVQRRQRRHRCRCASGPARGGRCGSDARGDRREQFHQGRARPIRGRASTWVRRSRARPSPRVPSASLRAVAPVTWPVEASRRPLPGAPPRRAPTRGTVLIASGWLLFVVGGGAFLILRRRST